MFCNVRFEVYDYSNLLTVSGNRRNHRIMGAADMPPVLRVPASDCSQ